MVGGTMNTKTLMPLGAAWALAFSGSACTAASTSEAPAVPGPPSPVSLSEKYSAYFPIGAAVDPTSIRTHSALLESHFNSITTENEMKFESLQKAEGSFDFEVADSMVAFAKSRGMKVRGHALVWHRQTPPWVFTDGSGGDASREALLGRLESHISRVVSHFKGSVYAWDVVNEAIMDNGAYRTATEPEADQQSKWHGITGEAYIAEAFKYAHAADPEAKLFYNDYYNYIPAKRQAIYEMLKKLLADGVPIHGVGLQCHLSIEPSTVETSHGYHQTLENLGAAIELYSSLGLAVQVTELDVSLYIPGVKYTAETYYTNDTFTDALEAKQARRYGELFALLRKHREVINGVTFWGIADDNTWLSEFSSGRQDFPLLFDASHEPKQAFHAVVDF
jgi:endo-1,4-beta-xylanase